MLDIISQNKKYIYFTIENQGNHGKLIFFFLRMNVKELRIKFI
jgi:hypothetical protein